MVGCDCSPGEVWDRADDRRRGGRRFLLPPGLLGSSLTLLSAPFFFLLVSASMWCVPHLCSMPTLPSTSLPRMLFCLSIPCLLPECKACTWHRSSETCREPTNPASIICSRGTGGHTDNQHPEAFSTEQCKAPPSPSP